MATLSNDKKFNLAAALGAVVQYKEVPGEAGINGWKTHKTAHTSVCLTNNNLNKTETKLIITLIQNLMDYDKYEVTQLFRKSGKDSLLISKVDICLTSIYNSLKSIKENNQTNESSQLYNHAIDILYRFIFYKRDIRGVGAKQRYLVYKIFDKISMIDDSYKKIMPLFYHFGSSLDYTNILKDSKNKDVKKEAIKFIAFMLKRDLIKICKSKKFDLSQEFINGIEKYEKMSLNQVIIPSLNKIRNSISDEINISISLMAKWTSHKKFNDKRFCKIILDKIFNIMDEDNENFKKCYLKVYRLLGTSLRSILDIVEKRMCSQDLDGINVSKICAGAVSKYHNFLHNLPTKHNENRPSTNPAHIALADRMRMGKVDGKINAVVNDLYALGLKFHSKIGYNSTDLSSDDIESMEYEFTQKYNELEKKLSELEVTDQNFMFCCDISGSMGQIQGVACILTMFGALLSKLRGPNGFPMFSTFEEQPTIHEFDIEGQGAIKAYQTIMSSRVGYFTNVVEQVKQIMRTILDFNSRNPGNRITQMPNIVFVTDSYFNDLNRHTSGQTNDTMMEFVEKMVLSNGLSMRNLVFWNLNGTSDVNVVKNNIPGVITIQGKAEAIVLQVFTSKYVSPFDHFVNTMNQEYFDIVSYMLKTNGNSWHQMRSYLNGDVKKSSGSGEEKKQSSESTSQIESLKKKLNDVVEIQALKDRIKELEKQ